MADARPLVVLLPPLGCDAAIYAPLEGALAPHARVVGIDYRAFEDAPNGAQSEPSRGLHAVARHAIARIRALEGEIAILGGVSLGGTVSVAIARDVKPRALLLMAPGGLPVAAVRKNAILDGMAGASAEDFARRSLGIDTDAFEGSAFATHFTADTSRARAYFAHLRSRTWAPERAAERAAAYGAMLRAALDVDLGEMLAMNDVPTDLVWGEADRVFSSRTWTRYAKALAASRFHLLPDVGHFAPLDATESIARIVHARLSEL